MERELSDLKRIEAGDRGRVDDGDGAVIGDRAVAGMTVRAGWVVVVGGVVRSQQLAVQRPANKDQISDDQTGGDNTPTGLKSGPR